MTRDNSSARIPIWMWFFAITLVGWGFLYSGIFKSWTGQNLPAAVTVQAGQTVTARPTLTKLENGWYHCGRPKLDPGCGAFPVMRSPAIYSLKNLHLDKDCFTDYPENPVHELKIASTQGGGIYTVEYSRDGKRLRICSKGGSRDNDVLVVWSDDDNARRIVA